MSKKGLVISGGGSKGAWAGGVCEYLIKEEDKDWDCYVGTSTGNLLIPSISVHEIDVLKEQYCNIETDDIFDVNPFNDKGNPRIWNLIWRLLRKKLSLGEADKLRDKIEEFFTEDDYKLALKANKDLFSCVTNFTRGQVEFKHNKFCTWQDYCDWMLASASVPIAFEPVEKNSYLYLDGGIMESLPLQKCIEEGCTEIDIIVLKTKTLNHDPDFDAKNMIDIIKRTESLLLRAVTMDDVAIGQLMAKEDTVKLNFYYTPRNLTNNSVHFNKEEMEQWWEEGYEFAKNKQCENIVLKKSGKSYKKLS